MALGPGTRLGPYVIAAPIGSGGMGEVYKAADTRLDRTVAVKVLPEHVATDVAVKQRFEREAKTLAALSHPHICPIHDVGSQNGVDFLVMEYLEGETLEQRLKKGALPLDQALQLAIQITDGLDKAHREGIVHRDLKPGNVMLTKSGVKLLDFGLAKVQPAGAVAGMSVAATMTSPLTAQGTILGTLHYMAPEQVEGKDADARSDIFSFGVIVYEMATGTRAFEGKSAASVMAAILERDPPAMSSLQPLTPPLLDHIVKRCLAKDPDERWQSARDLHDAFSWIADEGGNTTSTPIPATGFRPRERVAWLLAAIALIAVVAGSIWVLPRPVPMRPLVRFDVSTPAASDLTSFALSPDGAHLVFAAAVEGPATLWVRQLDETTARSLAGTEGATYPFWSPDSRSIGFFADGKLKRIDVAGGAPQVLSEAPNGRGGTWSTEGVILFTPTNTLADPNTVVMRIAATGGTPVAVTHLMAGQGGHRFPQFLPDGRRFLFFIGFSSADVNGVYLGSLDGREPVRLLPTDTPAQFVPPDTLLVVRQGVLQVMQFDPEGGTISGDGVPVTDVGTDTGIARSAFSIAHTGVLAYRPTGGSQRRHLMWVDRSGTRVGMIGEPDDAALSNPRLEPGGRRLAIHRAVGGAFDVWVMDPVRGSATRLTFAAGSDVSPIWSADGRSLMFESVRSGTLDLFETQASGASEEHLVLRDAGVPLSASRDGRFLLYQRNDSKTRNDLWALPLGADRKPFSVVQTTFDERGGEFSPDGRWIVYESDESGQFEIYIRSFPAAGGKWVVSTKGGTQPRWSDDGKELYYVAPDTRLMRVSITASADGQTLDASAPVPLFPTRLASGPGFAPGEAQYAVAPDGRFLLNTVVDEASASPITVVLNWTTALKQ